MLVVQVSMVQTLSIHSLKKMVNHPISMYAVTKSNELMAHAYSHLYIPTTD